MLVADPTAPLFIDYYSYYTTPTPTTPTTSTTITTTTIIIFYIITSAKIVIPFWDVAGSLRRSHIMMGHGYFLPGRFTQRKVTSNTLCRVDGSCTRFGVACVLLQATMLTIPNHHHHRN